MRAPGPDAPLWLTEKSGPSGTSWEEVPTVLPEGLRVSGVLGVESRFDPFSFPLFQTLGEGEACFS